MSRIGQTIVIIDDDESVRRALGRLMRSVNRTVVTFATAEEFLQSEVQSVAACLILDVHLPGLSGLELQGLLNAEGRGIPVVFITAYLDESMRDLALQAGAVAFLQKPFEDQSLLAAVAEAVA